MGRACHATNPRILREGAWFLARRFQEQGGGDGESPGTCWKCLKTADGSAEIAISAHAKDNRASPPHRRLKGAWSFWIFHAGRGLRMILSAIVLLACYRLWAKWCALTPTPVCPCFYRLPPPLLCVYLRVCSCVFCVPHRVRWLAG